LIQQVLVPFAFWVIFYHGNMFLTLFKARLFVFDFNISTCLQITLSVSYIYPGACPKTKYCLSSKG